MTTPQHTPPSTSKPATRAAEPTPVARYEHHADACADCGHTAAAHDPDGGHCLAGAYAEARCDCLGFEPDATPRNHRPADTPTATRTQPAHDRQTQQLREEYARAADDMVNAHVHERAALAAVSATTGHDAHTVAAWSHARNTAAACDEKHRAALHRLVDALAAHETSTHDPEARA